MATSADTQALLLGVMVFLAIFLALERAGMMPTPQTRRAGALFGAATGFLVMLHLQENPALLAQMVEKHVMEALAVLSALLALLRRP